VSICDFICDPSFWIIEQAMTGRETPHARPNPLNHKIQDLSFNKHSYSSISSKKA